VVDTAAIEADAVFRVGRVASVEGRRVKVRVDKLKNSAHLLYRGQIVRNVGVGSYVKIAKGFVELVGKVEGETVHEDRAGSRDYGRPGDRVARTLDVSLVGFLNEGRFKSGVRELPLLDNECFVLRDEEFRAIHALAASGRAMLEIGVLAMEPTQPVWIDVDAIFGSHIGIFGNTGSGKSYTLAKLYYELFRKHAADLKLASASRFLLVDFNGEYVDRKAEDGPESTKVIVGGSAKASYRLSTRRKDGGDRLPMSRDALHDPLFWTVLLDATEKTQAPFIRRVLASRYWDRVVQSTSELHSAVADVVWRATRTSDPGIDRQTATYILRDVESCLGDAVTDGLADLIQDFSANLQYHSVAAAYYWGSKYNNHDDWEQFIKSKVTSVTLDFGEMDPINLIRFRIILQYYGDIVSGHSNREHLSPLIKRLNSRVDDVRKVICLSTDEILTKPLTVISLREVNLDMRKVIPMLLCKSVYDRKKEQPVDGSYLNIIIDEAHNILSTQSTRESDAWRDYRLETFEEIIKEGRKFGVFLTIASQRPHDISETIISQLHNYFLHRLINNLDIHAIERAVAYLDAVSFESLPILATGSCVMAGVSAQVPVVIEIGALPEEAAPDSRTMSVVEAWRRGADGNSDMIS
jgi:DNA helicase HerA-like ATPase